MILFKTIKLLKHINTNVGLQSRICSLLLCFPEMPDVKVSEATFNELVYNRKTQGYQKAIEIARLIMLQYHPDVSKGRNDVLALMFDMNVLWERFVFVSLRKHIKGKMSISSQTSKYFWRPVNGYRSSIRPDIVIINNREDCIVLDTKWKNLSGCNPSPEDLRQMYVYHDYYNAKRVTLVYPGTTSEKVSGRYLDKVNSKETNKECCIISLAIDADIKRWQLGIYSSITEWMGL